MAKIGVFGTCRIDDYNIYDFVKITKDYPYVYKNTKYTVNVRPLSYSTTTSDILQNLTLIKNKKYLEITDKFIFNNIFLKHGGKSYIPDIDYDYLVLEICSLKKIIHKATDYIIPYEIEGTYNKCDFLTFKEDESETINNIKKIRDLINCKIILLPPIIEFDCNVIKGVHEDVPLEKVLSYRKEILNRLKKVSVEENIYLIDWNEIIIKEGIKQMLTDQFHFTDYGKKYISKYIINKISVFDSIFFGFDKININTINSSNFGDGINKLFWEYLTKNKIYDDKTELHYITTGSVMCLINNKSIIFGTGFISKNADLGGNNFRSTSSIKHVIPHKIIALRGPLSRQKMLDFNIECPENYGDPLILMPCLNNNYKNIEDNIIGIIPHYIDKNNKNYNTLKTNLENKGYNVKVIDIEVGTNHKKIIDEINNCKYIISSSLHGVIMGIVYKKKTIFIEFSDKVFGNGFKFEDFFKSVNITYKNINTYDIRILDNIINVDYEYLIKTGIKLISLIPFISSERKIELINKYNKFYN